MSVLQILINAATTRVLQISESLLFNVYVYGGGGGVPIPAHFLTSEMVDLLHKSWGSLKLFKASV